MDDLTWYLFRTTAMAERAVARRLKYRLGGVYDEDHGDVLCEDVATFVPIAHWTVRRRHQKRVPRERLVLPGYLFVGFGRPVPWLDLKVTGLHGVLAPVSGEFVGEIASKCWSGYFSPNTEPMVQRGMRVVARSGRFKGVEGDVVSIDRGQTHANVVMELLGQLPVRVSLDDLVSVSYLEYGSNSDDRLYSAA